MRYMLSLWRLIISLKGRRCSHGGNVVPARSREGIPTVGMDAELGGEYGCLGGEYGCLSDKPACKVASQHDSQHVQFAEMNRRLVVFCRGKVEV